MSRIPVESGIPFRREQPQTQVVDTFVGLRAPGPQMTQAAPLPRWQSELFDVAQALGGLSGSLDSLSRTWGKIGVEQEEMVGGQQFAAMTEEQRRDLSAMSWADFEKKNPEFKGASPFRLLAIRQAAGKAEVEQKLGKALMDNAERLSDPNTDEDARSFANQQLQNIVQGMSSVYSRDAALRFGGDMTEKFVGAVEESRRKRTVLLNDKNFQMEVKDVMSERVVSGEFTTEGLSSAIKAIQDKYYTITGESGNLAVFEATKGLAETMIASGRYDDARELIRGMNGYSHNGEVTYGKMYAQEFAELIDKADDAEYRAGAMRRQDTGARVSQAASEAMFKLDANTLNGMTEGQLKALAQETTTAAGLGPENFGEMYDTILQIRESQRQRLQGGAGREKEDLRMFMEIRSEAMQPGADLPALRERVLAAYSAGQLGKETTLTALGHIENAGNHYGDNASRGVVEQRNRLEMWMNPRDVPSSALPEYGRITSNLRAEFDDRIIAAREEVITELNAKKIPVNPDSINSHMADKARAIADEIMKRSETDFASFREKYEPRALLAEYARASIVLQEGMRSLFGQMELAEANAKASGDTERVEALTGDRMRVSAYLRKLASSKLKELSANGIEGQELYDQVDVYLDSEIAKMNSVIRSVGEGRSWSGYKPKTSEYPLNASIRASNASAVSGMAGIPDVPKETYGMTQASAFGNDFRDWVGELGAADEADLANARANTIREADAFVKQVGRPAANGITISGGNIMRGGSIDQTATSTYWNAKVKWSGLSVAEVRTGRTDEGLEIPQQFLVSRFTRIKGLDSEAALRSAAQEYESSGSGPLADYMDALPYTLEPRQLVDLLRKNLKEIGVIAK